MKFKRKIEKSDIVSIAIIILLVTLFIVAGIQYAGIFKIGDGGINEAAENLKALILSFGEAGVVVFTLMHALQVVIAAIPAAVVQFVGGVIYGTFWGVIITEIGVAVGTAVAFCLSRSLGRRVITLFVSEKALSKAEKLVSTQTSDIVLFALFIVPGFPKDILAYLLGLTNAKATKFFLISAAGRIPGIFVSTYLGANILEINHALIIAISAATALIFILMYVYRNKIIAFVSKKDKSKLNKKAGM